jgi:hypothetical protein
MRVQQHPFVSDSRGNRLEAYEIRRPHDVESAVRWVDLRGPDEVARQVVLAFAGAVVQVVLPNRRAGEWTHRLEMRRGVPEGLVALLDQLKGVLTLPRSKYLDVAIALDFYKVPPEGDEQRDKWDNTEVGGLVHRAKYYRFSPYRQRRAQAELVARTARFVRGHPLYSSAGSVIAPPGHKGSGNSFGEQFAGLVAKAVDKPMIRCLAQGERRPSKEGNGDSSQGTFDVASTLRGPVIIVDDVYRSGGTMRAVAFAARRAGAGRVFGFAAVKTMRN